MARKILCPNCEKLLSGLAIKYHELFESVEGKAKEGMRCDDCGDRIYTDETCFASVLLPNKNHFQYPNQKPEAWMHDYITVL